MEGAVAPAVDMEEGEKGDDGRGGFYARGRGKVVGGVVGVRGGGSGINFDIGVIDLEGVNTKYIHTTYGGELFLEDEKRGGGTSD